VCARTNGHVYKGASLMHEASVCMYKYVCIYIYIQNALEYLYLKRLYTKPYKIGAQDNRMSKSSQKVIGTDIRTRARYRHCQTDKTCKHTFHVSRMYVVYMHVYIHVYDKKMLRKVSIVLALNNVRASRSLGFFFALAYAMNG
jgi:hypothetical protein